MIVPTFLKEDMDFHVMENLILEKDVTGGKIKNYFIKGPFLEANIKNKNDRIYPFPVLEREVDEFNKSKIATKSAVGELGHPDSVQINEERISHLITELSFVDKNICVGKALIGNTPMGKIAKSLLDMGVRMGVSSRGLGTLKEGVVQNDYKLKTVDCVAEPSAPNAWVEGIMESKKDWVYENGLLTEKEIETFEKKLDTYTVEDRQTAILRVFDEVLNTVAKK